MRSVRRSPAAVRFTTALPKTRSAKVLRRAIRSVVTGDAPGDLSGLEDPGTLDAIAARLRYRADRRPRLTPTVACRRLGTWREVRVRSRQWLERWEPVPEPGSADPAVDYEAFRARCAAWERQRHFDAAYGFGLFLSDGRFAGEVSLGSVQRGPFQRAMWATGSTRRAADNEYVPEGVVLIIRYAFETLRLHRLEAAIVPRNAASRRSRKSSACVTKVLRSGSYKSKESTRTTSDTRSPRRWQDRGGELVSRFLTPRVDGR